MSQQNNKFRYEEENHIHPLMGFYNFDNSDHYLIDNISFIKNTTGITDVILRDFEDLADNNDHADFMKESILEYIKNDILKPNKYDNKIHYPDNFDGLTSYDIKVKGTIYNYKTEMYKIKLAIYNTEQNQYKTDKYKHKLETHTNNLVSVMSGGKLLREISPDICDRAPKNKLTGLQRFYGEPVIGAIESAISKILHNMNLFSVNQQTFNYVRGPYGNTYFYDQTSGSYGQRPSTREFDIKYGRMYADIIIELQTNVFQYLTQKMIDVINVHFTRDNFVDRTWRQVIMYEHLMNHKYAHNGIGKNDAAIITDMLSLINLENPVDLWSGLHFIHSYLHTYDKFIMSNKSKKILRSLEELDNNISDVDQRDCMKLKLNVNNMDFLVRDISGEFDVPYHIKDEALADKQRQYDHEYDKLIPDFRDVIRYGNSSYIKTGTTVIGPGYDNLI